MSLERIGKLGHDPGFSPFAGIEHTLGIEIVKQADVIGRKTCKDRTFERSVFDP